jgi:hypothetical protein
MRSLIRLLSGDICLLEFDIKGGFSNIARLSRRLFLSFAQTDRCSSDLDRSLVLHLRVTGQEWTENLQMYTQTMNRVFMGNPNVDGIIWHGLFGNVFTTYLLFTNAQKSTPETLQPGRDLSSNIGQGLLFPTQGGQGSFWHNTIRCDR